MSLRLAIGRRLKSAVNVKKLSKREAEVFSKHPLRFKDFYKWEILKLK